MTSPISSALQSLFAKRGFAWSEEIAGRQSSGAGDPAVTRRVDVLDVDGAPVSEIDVPTSDDPSSLFRAIAPLGERERQRLFRELEQAEYSLIDALLAAYDRESWATSALRENLAADDEVEWETLADARRDDRRTRAVLARQLAEAMERDEWAPPDALRIAKTLIGLRARLFRDSIRIAISMAKEKANDLDWVLALSTACMGLLIAIDRFEPSRGFQFSTYAVWWIRHGVGRMRDDDARPLRLPVHVTARLRQFLRGQRELWAKLGRLPSEDEITELAEAHGLRPWSASHLIRPVSAARIGSGGDAERIIDPEIPSPAQGGLPGGWVSRFEPVLDAWLGFAATRATLHRSSSWSKDQSRREEVLRARFGIGRATKTTLREIGESFGLSRERIRQIQEIAQAVLRRFEARGALDREPWMWRLPPDE